MKFVSDDEHHVSVNDPQPILDENRPQLPSENTPQQTAINLTACSQPQLPLQPFDASKSVIGRAVTAANHKIDHPSVPTVPRICGPPPTQPVPISPSMTVPKAELESPSWVEVGFQIGRVITTQRSRNHLISQRTPAIRQPSAGMNKVTTLTAGESRQMLQQLVNQSVGGLECGRPDRVQDSGHFITPEARHSQLKTASLISEYRATQPANSSRVQPSRPPSPETIVARWPETYSEARTFPRVPLQYPVKDPWPATQWTPAMEADAKRNFAGSRNLWLEFGNMAASEREFPGNTQSHFRTTAPSNVTNSDARHCTNLARGPPGNRNAVPQLTYGRSGSDGFLSSSIPKLSYEQELSASFVAAEQTAGELKRKEEFGRPPPPRAPSPDCQTYFRQRGYRF